jgi:hypothetical protein
MNGQVLNFKQKDAKIIIQLPENPPDENDTVIELHLNGSADRITPVDIPQNRLRGLYGSKVQIQSDYSKKYATTGAESLIDEIRGSKNYQDGKWLGFEGVDFEVVIDLIQPKSISHIALGCLQNQNYWIFLPGKVEFFTSTDGKDFSKAGAVSLDADKRSDTAETRDIGINLKVTHAQFIKIVAENIKACPTWHKGKGGKAWLFVDEIIIK